MFLPQETRLCQGSRLGSNIGRPTRLLPALATIYLFAIAVLGAEKPTCADEARQGSTYGKVRLPNLKVESVLRSQQPREKHDITIITQCSLDRLYMLEEQCNTWQGITSVAVYYPLYIFQNTNADRLREAITTVENFHEQIDRSHGKCRMDIVLLSEVIKPQDAWSYPYNALRNHALIRSETDVLLLLDADFLVSQGVHEALTASDKASALMDDLTANKRIIVLPAFETPRSLSEDTGRTYALEAQACTKSELKSMFDEGKIIQFADFYNVGHGSTNYKKWFTASEPYPITYKTGYEPYVLVDRRTVPWYDERFRGYGWDKVMQIYHMDAMAFHFVSHPEAWVVHRPHPNSAGYNQSFTGEAYSTNHRPTDHMAKMEKIAYGMMDELKVGTYPDVGVTQLAVCREKWAEGGKIVVKSKNVWW